LGLWKRLRGLPRPIGLKAKEGEAEQNPKPNDSSLISITY